MIKTSYTCNSLTIKHFFVFVFKYLFTKNKNDSNQSLTNCISKYFDIQEESIFLFGAGRMGLFLFLKSLNLNSDNEVIVTGYTCVVLTNTLKFLNIKIKYVDININTLNIDTDKLYLSINKNTKAIIVSHNFGIVYEDIELIKRKFPQLIIIEDCAHTFGSVSLNNKKAGLIGDASFFSFEYSKPITCGFGGLLIINNKEMINNVKRIYDDLDFFPADYIRKILLLLFSYLFTSYKTTSFLSRYFVAVLKRLKLLPLVEYSKDELNAVKPKYYPVKLSYPQSYLIYLQLKEIDKINKKKKIIAERYFSFLEDIPYIKNYYNKNYIYVRYPITFNFAIQKAKIKELKDLVIKNLGIEFGEWFNDVIHPKGSIRYNYEDGYCKNGEFISQNILNLPVNLHYMPDKHTLLMLKNILMNFNFR
jgi:perosamine synthetase